LLLVIVAVKLPFVAAAAAMAAEHHSPQKRGHEKSAERLNHA